MRAFFTRRVYLAPLALVMHVLLWCLRHVSPRLARVLGRRRERTGRLRSLWAVTPILTLPLLARADRLLGMHSDSMVYVTYYITRAFDRDFSRSHRWLVKHAPELYRQYCELVFLLVLPYYDIFHYFYDRGLMASDKRFGISAREVEYLKTAGKRLYTYAYGADVRERTSTLALGDWNFCRECDDPGRYCICDAEQLADSMAPLLQGARARNAMGDMLTYVPQANHLHYWPIDLRRIPHASERTRQPGQPLVVAHAPNHGHFKGTSYVQAAVDQLRTEGHVIELRFIHGVPNTQVLAMFAEADLVIDQLVGGFYGYTALEAMALGKPVISYVRSPELTLPECPVINATPDTIVSVLRQVEQGAYDLAALGRAGMEYVRRHNSLEAVAVRLADMYLSTGCFPETVTHQLHDARQRLVVGLTGN